MMGIMRIEDYALIGNLRTAALVSKDGSIDWLCMPHFDSNACFASLLGTPENGRWLLRPEEYTTTRRRYREDSLVLETDFENEQGSVRITDCMLPGEGQPSILRMVEGLEGGVDMKMELTLRMDYGSIIPWVTRLPFGGIKAIAGPDAIRLKAAVPLEGKDYKTFAHFRVEKGRRLPFVLSWAPSNMPSPPEIENPPSAIESATLWWRNWMRRCTYQGPYKEAVHRSLITLKALTYQPTGGMVAAATTSLPEALGGSRNWDYRFCWLRDATATLTSLLRGGYRDEALQWRDWLLRAIAGHPSDIRIMYSIDGAKRLPELELHWLAGYEKSKPVRTGNAASVQRQLDVFGGVMETFQRSRVGGLEHDQVAWNVQQKLVELVEKIWREPDHGIWEVRGKPQNFTYSKVMAWQAMDRAVTGVRQHGLKGNADHWQRIANEIHAEVCDKGFNSKMGSFVQAFGSDNLDASLLLLPMTGFIKAGDERMKGTVRAIEKSLLKNGVVLRYQTERTNDGLSGVEGAFLACTFWLADNLLLQGRLAEGKAIFEELLALRNDVGLLAEEYDPAAKRMLGNFPQAFSHLSLLHTAFLLEDIEQH
jgi:GH15 family glucan-1,4-alpha-glucosidase